MSAKQNRSKKVCSGPRLSATNLATTSLTLMRIPAELRRKIYDFLWSEDITIDLLSYAHPILGGRYNETRGGITPRRLIYNSLQLLQRAKGGFRGGVQGITALRVCREFWHEGLSRGRFNLEGDLADLQIFLCWKSSQPYFPLVCRLTLHFHHTARHRHPYYQLFQGLHEAAESFPNLRELDLSIDDVIYTHSIIDATGKAVQDIVDSFPIKKPLLLVEITDGPKATDAPKISDGYVYDTGYTHGFTPYKMSTFNSSQCLFRTQSAKSFPQLRRVTIRGDGKNYHRGMIQQYEYKGWGFEETYFTGKASVADASLWSEAFARRLHEPIWVYTLKER
jgi:hypothetical protein